MDDTETYNGIVTLGHGENDDAVVLYEPGKGDIVLAEEVAGMMDSHGHYLSVRYFTSDTRKTADEIDLALAKMACGLAEAEYSENYSEITGYLWTDETLNVGGHDLLDELRSFDGKWAWLEITYHKHPVPAS